VLKIASEISTGIDTLYLTEFENCKVVPPSAVLTQDNSVYEPSLDSITAVTNFYRGLSSSIQDRTMLIDRSVIGQISDLVEGRSFHALHESSHNFGHFLCEVMSRLVIIKDIGEENFDHIVVPDRSFHLSEQACHVIGLDPGKLMKIGQGKLFKNLTYANCTHSSYMGVLLNEQGKFRDFNLPKVDPLDLIYLSREDSSNRFIVNEPQVIDLIRSLGFNPLIGSGMGVGETIARIRAAKIIVGSGGPFTQAVMYGRPGTILIELASTENSVTPQYGKWGLYTKDLWQIADLLDIRFGIVMGKGFSWSPLDEEYMRLNTNYVIPLKDLREVVEAALAAL
jgi:hypothetical protein